MFGGAMVASAQEGPPPQEPPQGPPRGGGQGMRFQIPSFQELDKNKDHKISRDEWPSNLPPQLFDRIDENHDGVIDEDEYNRWRSRAGAGGGARFSEGLMKFLDVNHDGKITREEFARITQLFDLLDQDHNGVLTQEELGRFFQVVNEAQTRATGGIDVDALFQKYDKNKDGKLTPDELTNPQLFKALDLNKDGVITRDEAEQAIKQMQKASQEKKAQSQPPNK